jgi:hypothetical protein
VNVVHSGPLWQAFAAVRCGSRLGRAPEPSAPRGPPARRASGSALGTRRDPAVSTDCQRPSGGTRLQRRAASPAQRCICALGPAQNGPAAVAMDPIEVTSCSRHHGPSATARRAASPRRRHGYTSSKGDRFRIRGRLSHRHRACRKYTRPANSCASRAGPFRGDGCADRVSPKALTDNPAPSRRPHRGTGIARDLLTRWATSAEPHTSAPCRGSIWRPPLHLFGSKP